jgi:drug/metabolite transporter (DMT)-like permease
MRTIAGALLLIAASICFGAAVVADNLPHQAGFRPQGIAYLAAMILGIWGFVVLLVGLALDRQTDSQRTPAWVWITLLVLFVGVVGLVAFMRLAARGPG